MIETVKIEIEMPITDYTEDELIEWLRYNLHYTDDISTDNPLSPYYIEANQIDLIF